MHYKQKNKLLKTTKLYTTFFKDDETLTTKLRCQIGKEEYALFDLYDSFPSKISFEKLKGIGFGFDPKRDDQIVKYGKAQTLKVLENSKKIKDINLDTIDKLIDLISNMKEGDLKYS